jgi:hypothetical protein
MTQYLFSHFHLNKCLFYIRDSLYYLHLYCLRLMATLSGALLACESKAGVPDDTHSDIYWRTSEPYITRHIRGQEQRRIPRRTRRHDIMFPQPLSLKSVLHDVQIGIIRISTYTFWTIYFIIQDLIALLFSSRNQRVKEGITNCVIKPYINVTCYWIYTENICEACSIISLYIGDNLRKHLSDLKKYFVSSIGYTLMYTSVFQTLWCHGPSWPTKFLRDPPKTHFYD